MPRLDELANVALRVPSILVLDLLYKCDIEGLTDHLKAKNEDMLFKYKYVIWNMYYLGKHAWNNDRLGSFYRSAYLSVCPIEFHFVSQMFHVSQSYEL